MAWGVWNESISQLLGWARCTPRTGCCSFAGKRCLRKWVCLCNPLGVASCGCLAVGQEDPGASWASLTRVLLLCSAFLLQPPAVRGRSGRVPEEKGDSKCLVWVCVCVAAPAAVPASSLLHSDYLASLGKRWKLAGASVLPWLAGAETRNQLFVEWNEHPENSSLHEMRGTVLMGGLQQESRKEGAIYWRLFVLVPCRVWSLSPQIFIFEGFHYKTAFRHVNKVPAASSPAQIICVSKVSHHTVHSVWTCCLNPRDVFKELSRRLLWMCEWILCCGLFSWKYHTGLSS